MWSKICCNSVRTCLASGWVAETQWATLQNSAQMNQAHECARADLPGECRSYFAQAHAVAGPEVSPNRFLHRLQAKCVLTSNRDPSAHKTIPKRFYVQHFNVDPFGNGDSFRKKRLLAPSLGRLVSESQPHRLAQLVHEGVAGNGLHGVGAHLSLHLRAHQVKGGQAVHDTHVLHGLLFLTAVRAR